MDIIRDPHIDWLKYRWHFIGLSLLVIGLGALDLARKGGPRYGIDFSEGTIVYAKFEKTPQIDAVRQKLAEGGIGEAVIQRYDREELNPGMIRAERGRSWGGTPPTSGWSIPRPRSWARWWGGNSAGRRETPRFSPSWRCCST